MHLVEGDNCSCSWERGTVDHIAGRGIELGERRQLVIQLGEGAVGHRAGRWGQLVIPLGEAAGHTAGKEGALVIQLGEGGNWSYSWERG